MNFSSFLFGGQDSFCLVQNRFSVRQCQSGRTFTHGFQSDGKIGIPIVIIKNRKYLQVAHMYVRNSIEIDISENAAESEEVLIFEPASRRKTEHHNSELILTFVVNILCEIKFGGRKAVFCIAYILPVQPDGHTALHPLKRDENLLF